MASIRHFCTRLLLPLLTYHVAFGPLCFGQEQPPRVKRIVVASDKKSFVFAGTEEKFTPWGFNYDHDDKGDLIEDYWEQDWKRVQEDFQEMKDLGTNVVRIHLQLGKFMKSPSEANEKELAHLKKLLHVAEKLGIYLDLTGLGCYHKKDVPAWYDPLSEQDRWNVQARFWEAIASVAKDSPAVFCYDLMNEPVVPGSKGKRDDWLGPAFGGKHFVQFIALETKGRARPDVARQWIHQLVSAIRKHDKQHLITVGLVPWSLDRPGLTSGFVPESIASELDFISVHIYPESGKIDEALQTLEQFSVGKPVVIEELFCLKCSAKELETFIDRSRKHAAGWIGFYWGKTLEEYRKGTTIGDALMRQWLELFQKRSAGRE